MVNGKNANLACLSSNTKDGKTSNIVDCTEEIMCPGWNEYVKCLSFGDSKDEIECRTCDPSREAWLGIETGNRKGI